MDLKPLVLLLWIFSGPVQSFLTTRVYWYHSTPRPWEEANEFCRSEYSGSLATVVTDTDLTQMDLTEFQAWVGLKNKTGSGWQWVSGDNFGNTFAEGEPESGEECGKVIRLKTEAYGDKCDQKHFVFCRIGNSDCLFVPETKTWSEGKDYCDKNAVEYLKRVFVSDLRDFPVWIGLRHDGQEWNWRDEIKSDYRNWASGQEWNWRDEIKSDYRNWASGNLALNGEATQSTTYQGGNASNAIDGNREAVYSRGSCMHTLSYTESWWRVDLKKSYWVFSIIITNRGDCCPERLNGTQIHVGNSLENNGNNNKLVTTIQHIPKSASETFFFEPTEGRYVTVFLPREEYLTLCEVEVYGRGSDPDPKYGADSCVAVSSQSKFMSVQSCSEAFPFLCYKHTLVQNIVLVKELLTWEQALETCRNLNPNNHRMVSVELNELEYALRHAQGATTPKVWVGLRFLGGSWFWTDGSAVSLSLPQCPKSGLHCGALVLGQGRIEPSDCSQRFNVLCSREP